MAELSILEISSAGIFPKTGKKGFFSSSIFYLNTPDSQLHLISVWTCLICVVQLQEYFASVLKIKGIWTFNCILNTS